MEKKRTYGVWAVRSSTSIFGPAQSWCKENGKPLEFDTKAAAENYAKEANEHTTANVRYYVKEKEPEPGAVRKGTSQPELDARSHEEVIPRNDAAEKQNEIPGRQIPSQTDPLVEIRSAVHSNYAGMVAMLGADNRVYLGREERCHYQNMQPSYYDNQDGSLCFVCDQPDMYYFLYGEGWAHTQAEMLERGLMIHNLARKEGITVFLCTHQLRYAQEICTRYGLIDQGILLASGTIDELRARVFTSKSLRICASAVPDKLNFVKCGINEFETKIQDKKEIPYLVRKIVEAGEDIYSVNLIEPTLEDIYFTLTAGRKED